jgi:hypothetical protein
MRSPNLKTTPEHRWAVTAHHEAGHTVAYLHFGWKFGTIKIYQTDSGEVLEADRK